MTSWSHLQVYRRNPLCGINYPCGPSRTNTCIPLGNDSNYTNTSLLFNDTEDMIFNTTDSPTVMGEMMLNTTEVMLPRGFRICDQPNTALWSTTLALCTFLIAVLLRKLRQGKFLGKRVSVEIVFSSHCHSNQFFIIETHEGSRCSLVNLTQCDLQGIIVFMSFGLTGQLTSLSAWPPIWCNACFRSLPDFILQLSPWLQDKSGSNLA